MARTAAQALTRPFACPGDLQGIEPNAWLVKAAHAGLLCNGESCIAIVNRLKQLQRIAD